MKKDHIHTNLDGLYEAIVSEYRELIDDLRQLNIKIRISEFVQEHTNMQHEKFDRDITGKTVTLEYKKKIKPDSTKTRIMKQLDNKDSTMRAKCFIIGALQEKTPKVQKTIIKYLESIADEA